MRRFILRENIQRFEALLKNDASPSDRETLHKLLAEAKRELAWLEKIWLKTCPGESVSSEVGAAIECALDAIIERADAQFGAVHLWDDHTKTLHLLAHRNFDAHWAERFGLVRNGAGTVWDAAPTARSEIIIDDVEGDLRYASDLSWTRACGIRAIHTTPIFDGGSRLLGAFSIFYDRPRPIDAPQRRRNGHHAAYLGGLLQNIKSNLLGAAGA